MEIKATAKFIRQSPRKVRLAAALIKNLPIQEAQEQLKVLPKRAAVMVLKVLNSAIANAEHNRQLKKDSLFVARVFVDQGPTLKRFRARAFGRGAPIKKRTSHLTIVLAEKVIVAKEIKKAVKDKEVVKKKD